MLQETLISNHIHTPLSDDINIFQVIDLQFYITQQWSLNPFHIYNELWLPVQTHSGMQHQQEKYPWHTEDGMKFPPVYSQTNLV